MYENIKSKLSECNIIKNDGNINSNASKMFKVRSELYAELNNKTCFINSNRPNFLLEKLNAILNNIYNIPLCEICQLESLFIRSKKEYSLYCSKQCVYDSNLRKENHKNTMIERYGVEHALQNKESVDKFKITMQNKHGIDYAMKSPKLVNKFKNTIADRTPEEIKKTIDKRKDTMIERHGVEHALQSAEISNSRRNTTQQRYGRDFHSQTHISEDSFEKLNSYNWLYKTHILNKTPITMMGEILGVDPKIIKTRLSEKNIEHVIFNGSSFGERELCEYLTNFDIILKLNDREHISPYELDIFIPEKNIAIEYCGLYWHSELYKNKNYHKMKYDLCKERGIRLITIFEDEWLNKKNIVKKFIKNIITKTESVYARKTKIHNINIKDAKLILNNNHIQGYGSGKYKIGIFEENKLIGCAIFKQLSINKLQLIRYASSKRIVGGLSKIIKYMGYNFGIKEIETFSDNRYSDGNMYDKIGFSCIKEIKPDYYYILKNKKYHKFNFRHESLKKMIKDYNPNKTEETITSDNGINKIYDCGKKKYKLCLD